MLIDKPIPINYIFNKVKVDVLRVLALSIIFHIMKVFFSGYLPPIPLSLPTLLGTAISLLLAFNLNQSYDRWWEARKVWGAIVNDSRSLTLQIKGFTATDSSNAEYAQTMIRKIAFRQIVWCYCLGQSLRKQTPITPEQETLLAPEDITFLNTQKNRPFGLLMLHMSDLKSIHQKNLINSYQQIQIDNTIVRLCDSMGKAERINSTVFPVTYRTFIHYFIYLFLILLSVALVETVGIVEIPILTLVASSFFLLEKTARHMQDPFENKPTDTPMTAIARTIEINIRQVLEEPNVPPPLCPEGFYLM